MKQSERIIKDFNLQESTDMFLGETAYEVYIVPEEQIELLIGFLTLTLSDNAAQMVNDKELFYAKMRPTDEAAVDALVFMRDAYIINDSEGDGIHPDTCLIDMEMLRNNFDGEDDE